MLPWNKIVSPSEKCKGLMSHKMLALTKGFV